MRSFPLDSANGLFYDLFDPLTFMEEGMTEGNERTGITYHPQSPCNFLPHPPVLIGEGLYKWLNRAFVLQTGKYLHSLPSV